MKSNVVKSFLLILIALSTLSCASLFTKGGMDYEAAKRANSKGDYILAVEKALVALEKNPEYVEAQEILISAFTNGTSNYLKLAEEGTTSADFKSLESALGAYSSLISLHSLASNSGRSDLPSQDFQSDYDTTLVLLLKTYYTEGVSRLNTGNFKEARLAINFFNAILQYDPAFKDTNELLEQAKEDAIVVIAVFAPRDWGLSFHAMFALETEFAETITDKEFIKVLPVDTYKASMAGPFDQMLGDLHSGKIDFVLKIEKPIVNINYTEVENHGVPLPVENPVINSGFERGYDFHNTYSVSYSLYGEGLKIVDQGQISQEDKGGYRVYRSYWDQQDKKLTFDGDENYWDLGKIIPGIDYSAISDGLNEIEYMTKQESYTYDSIGGGLDLLNYYLSEYPSFDSLHDYFGDPIFLVVDGYYSPDTDTYFFTNKGANHAEAYTFRSKSWSIGSQVSRALYESFLRDKTDEALYYADLAYSMSEYIMATF